MSYKYIFGPVISRRIGISLGVDLVPPKNCTLNCVYCEIGKTSNLINNIEEFFPVSDILKELKEYLDKNPKLDYITFSGAGEPLLYSKIGEIISFIKTNYKNYKVCLITNGTLLFEKAVRDSVKNVDLIMPSLDAVSTDVFNKINRPHTDVKANEIIEGIKLFKKESSSIMWLEVFIIPGINDNESELTKLKEAIKLINPDRVQINSLDRPGTESWVEPANNEKLNEILNFFKPLNVEIIAKNFQKKADSSNNANLENEIISAIKRRPCTLDDLVNMTGKNIDEIDDILSVLINNNVIDKKTQDRGAFYCHILK